MISLRIFTRYCPKKLELDFGILHRRSKNFFHQRGIASPIHTSPIRDFKEDNKTTSIAVLENVKQIRHSPTPALALGFSGLIPFVAAPVYMINYGAFMPDIAHAQLCYGACILSFLGGVRWGLTLPAGTTQPPNWSNLIYGVTPSLIAWLGLLVSPPVGLLTVIGGLGLAGYMDLAMWGYPGWFKGMRFVLTYVAILSLWTSFMLHYVMDEETNKERIGKETEETKESK